jgi:hypothetical protein
MDRKVLGTGRLAMRISIHHYSQVIVVQVITPLFIPLFFFDNNHDGTLYHHHQGGAMDCSESNVAQSISQRV